MGRSRVGRKKGERDKYKGKEDIIRILYSPPTSPDDDVGKGLHLNIYQNDPKHG